MFNKQKKTIKKQSTPSPYLSLFYINKKETNIQKKQRKKRQAPQKQRKKRHDYSQAYSQERKRQQDHLKNVVARLDKLLEEGSINEDLHTRYKKILEIDYAKKRQQSREKYGFKTHLKF